MKTPVITPTSFKKCARQIIEEANASASNSDQREISDFFGFADEGLTTFQLFDLAYNIASDGNDKRDENIDKLTNIIQDLI